MSPELLRGDVVYNEEDEVWSLGVVLYLLLICHHPFANNFNRNLPIQHLENLEVIKQAYKDEEIC